jgi:hypothetical protein
LIENTKINALSILDCRRRGAAQHFGEITLAIAGSRLAGRTFRRLDVRYRR